MGTSASSEGPKSGVSFDPPWLNDEGDFEINEPSSNNDRDNLDIELEPSPHLAPPARFQNARNSIRKYAREGSGRDGFQKAAGHYSKTGMGGAGRLANRMRHSTSTGARLAQFLSSTNSRTVPQINEWIKDIVDRGLRGRDLVDAIIKQVAPSSGSKDEESCANSMAEALGEFLDGNEGKDLLNLETRDIREITEHFLANEACNRLTNDIGQIFERESLSLKESISRLDEMREYLRADLSVQIENLWRISANPTQSQIDQILRSAIQRTFEIYEGEI